jgi:hypothetical protein
LPAIRLTLLQTITSGNPAIVFAGLHPIYIQLRSVWPIAAPFCPNPLFFSQLFALVADPMLDPASQDSALRILKICLEAGQSATNSSAGTTST